MPSTKSYSNLHDKVLARHGSADRLGELRKGTLTELALHGLRTALDRSQADVAESLGISQSAISQLERGHDVKISTLRKYLKGLGAELRVLAVFDTEDEEIAIPLHIGADS